MSRSDVGGNSKVYQGTMADVVASKPGKRISASNAEEGLLQHIVWTSTLSRFSVDLYDNLRNLV
ncbi:MAG: hypothetical protein ACE5R6_10225 [Candidatus Heimdallarchaeota archaeon]